LVQCGEVTDYNHHDLRVAVRIISQCCHILCKPMPSVPLCTEHHHAFVSFLTPSCLPVLSLSTKPNTCCAHDKSPPSAMGIGPYHSPTLPLMPYKCCNLLTVTDHRFRPIPLHCKSGLIQK
jgi:hypothetical protein